MNKTKHITNPQVTEYMNRFYKAACPELEALRLQAEQDDVPFIL